MATSSILTPHQADILKIAAAIIYVIDDTALRPSLGQTTPLTQDQKSALERRLTDGLTRWDREVRNHRMPSAVEANRIAIAAVLLNQRYPEAVRRDDHNEITLPVSDIADISRDLSGDVSRFATVHGEWESRIWPLFGVGSATASPSRRDQATQVAERFGLAVAKSVGIDAIFNNAFAAGAVPEASVPALPTYATNDPRSQNLSLMAKLQVELSVTEGLLAAITPDTPDETHHGHMLKWIQARASTALGTVTSLFIPSGLSKLNSQLKDSQMLLTQSRDLLHVCLYGTEAELASESAQHRVERSPLVLLFLAICPSLFLFPPLEVRLLITKPLYYVTKGAHATLGKIPIFGFFFLMLRWAGQAVDAVPRWQVRLSQGIAAESVQSDPRKRARTIVRYLNYADRRATKPRVEAVQRILLGIVS